MMAGDDANWHLKGKNEDLGWMKNGKSQLQTLQATRINQKSSISGVK